MFLEELIKDEKISKNSERAIIDLDVEAGDNSAPTVVSWFMCDSRTDRYMYLSVYNYYHRSTYFAKLGRAVCSGHKIT